MLAMVTLLATFSGFVREVITAYFFGTSAAADGLSVILFYYDTAVTFILYGGIGWALVPLLSMYIVQRREGEGELVATALTFWTCGVVALAALVAVWYAPQLTVLLLPDLHGYRYDVQVMLIRFCFPGLALVVAAGIISAILQAYQRFIVPMIGRLMLNLVIVAATLIGARHWGIKAVAVGVEAGACAQLLLVMWSLRLAGWTWRPGPVVSTVLLDLCKASLPGLAMIALMNLVQGSIERFLLSGLVVGSLAAVNIAARTLSLVAGASLAIQTVAFSTMSRDRGSKDDAQTASRTMVQTLRTGLLLLVPISILVMTLSEPIVRLLFFRGEFDQASVRMTSAALRWYALSIGPGFVFGIASRAFYVFRRPAYGILIAVATVTVAVTTDVVMLPELRHVAIPLGYSIGFFVAAVVGLFLVQRRTAADVVRPVGVAAVQAYSLSALCLVAGHAVAHFVPTRYEQSPPWLVIIVFSSGAAFLGLYAVLCVLIRQTDAVVAFKTIIRFGERTVKVIAAKSRVQFRSGRRW